VADIHTNVTSAPRTTDAGGRDSSEPIDPDKSLGELVSQLTSDFSDLVSTQLEIAKVEIKAELSRATKGAGMLTAGGLTGYLALMLLSFAAAWGLSEGMPTGFAFLIVGLVWAAVALFLALTGRDQLRTVHPVPEQTKQTIKEDVEWAKQQRT
jgi:uncharacterized membrane protein YqjE